MMIPFIHLGAVWCVLIVYALFYWSKLYENDDAMYIKNNHPSIREKLHPFCDFSMKKPISSICVAALPLGKCGILRGKRATTYNGQVRRSALKKFGAQIINQPVVIDEHIITSWNPASAIDVALLLLEKLTNKNYSNFIRNSMGFTKNGESEQFTK